MLRWQASLSFIVFATALTTLPIELRAQQVTGAILGSVQDASGAVVVGAKVTARNQDTGLSRSVQSNAQGEYRIDFLPPGNYGVDVASTGFQLFRQTGVTLAIGQSARVDARLQVGQASSTVTVEGGVPVVNTADAAVGQTTTSEQITTLPLVNRTPYSLLTLTPGVQYTTSAITLGFPAQRTFINGGADATMGSVNYYLTADQIYRPFGTRVTRCRIRTRSKSSAWTPTTTARNMAASEMA